LVKNKPILSLEKQVIVFRAIFFGNDVITDSSDS
jgi:hypothetical protein